MDSELTERRPRSVPFSPEEIVYLHDIIMKYHNIIDTKKYNKISIALKNKIWIVICQKFNSVKYHRKRSVLQLRKWWDNMKSRRKKAELNGDKEAFDRNLTLDLFTFETEGTNEPDDTLTGTTSRSPKKNDMFITGKLEPSAVQSSMAKGTQRQMKKRLSSTSKLLEKEKSLERLKLQIELDKELHLLKVKEQELANKVIEELYLLGTEKREWERQLFEMKKTLLETKYEKEVKSLQMDYF